MRYEVLIIGCGEIGTSLIDGWLNKSSKFYKKTSRINVLEQNIKRKKYLKKKYKKKLEFVETNKINKSKKKFKYVFLTFKPKDLNSSLNLYRNLFDKNTIFYSVLAGKTLSEIKTFFPINKNIIRLMLNTPISVNKGTIIFYSLKKISDKDFFLLNLIGKVYRLKKEVFFDLITAIVGSGPAYFYYLLESMEKIAINQGLNKSFSKEILKDTYIGTAKIIENTKKNFTDIKKDVASKGGTTEAAINCLKRNHFQELIYNSIKDSIKKAKTLSSKKVR